MTTAVGNLDLSFISICMVGKVAAPPKANRMELNAANKWMVRQNWSRPLPKSVNLAIGG